MAFKRVFDTFVSRLSGTQTGRSSTLASRRRLVLEPLENRELLTADLMGMYFNADESLQWGDSCDVEAIIQNSGSSTADASTVNFYLSNDDNISTEDHLLGTRVIDQIAAGGRYRFSNETLRLPSSPPSGFTATDTVCIGMIVDALDSVIESNETNNLNRGNGYGRDAGLSITSAAVSAPRLITATATSSSTVHVAWSNVGADGYRVQKWELSGTTGGWALVEEVGPGVTDFPVVGLEPSTRYFFRVQAFDTDSIANSNYKGVTTPADEQNVTAPTLQTAEVISSTEVNLDWTDATNADGYKVLQWEPTGSWDEIYDTADDSTITDYLVTDLDPSTRYFFRVQAYNDSSTANSNYKSATTPADAPSVTAPRLQTAEAISSTEVELDWTDVTGADGYNVLQWVVGTGGTGSWELVEEGVTDSDYTVTDLEPSTTYFFRVQAYNDSSTANSNYRGVTTPADAPSVTAPKLQTAVAISSTEVELDWTDVTGADGYNVLQWVVGTGGTGSWVLVEEGVTDSDYTVSDLDPSTQYFFRVQAYNDSSTANSNYKSVTTLSDTPSVTAPRLQTAVAISSTEVELDWTDVTGADGYNVLQWVVGTGGTGSWVLVEEGVTDSDYTVSDLDPSTQYFFKVQAFIGTSTANSNYKSVTTLSDAPSVTAPRLMVAAALSSSEVKLIWTDVDGETSYKVLQWVVTGTTGSWVEVATAGQDSTTVTVSDLDPSTRYFFRVQACNDTGSTADSNYKSVFTQPIPA